MVEKKRYAEDLNFWKTGRSSPETWVTRAKKQIETLGAKIEAEAFGADDTKAAYMLGFSINGEKFSIVWPVMQSWRGDIFAARVQAATMLYHYTKSVCLYAVVVGPRAAFFAHLILPDGSRAAQLSVPELIERVPKMLLSGPTKSS